MAQTMKMYYLTAPKGRSPVGPGSFSAVGLTKLQSYQAHSDCWQNLVSCDGRTQAPVSLLAVDRVCTQLLEPACIPFYHIQRQQ